MKELCENCRERKSRIEMVAPFVPGRIEFCGKDNPFFTENDPEPQYKKVDMWMEGRIAYWPVWCKDFKESWGSWLSRFVWKKKDPQEMRYMDE